MLRALDRLLGEPRQHGEQKTLGLTRAGASGDDDTGATGVGVNRRLERLCLMLIRRVEEKFARFLGREAGQKIADPFVERERREFSISDIGWRTLDEGRLGDTPLHQ